MVEYIVDPALGRRQQGLFSTACPSSRPGRDPTLNKRLQTGGIFQAVLWPLCVKASAHTRTHTCAGAHTHSDTSSASPCGRMRRAVGLSRRVCAVQLGTRGRLPAVTSPQGAMLITVLHTASACVTTCAHASGSPGGRLPSCQTVFLQALPQGPEASP